MYQKLSQINKKMNCSYTGNINTIYHQLNAEMLNYIGIAISILMSSLFNVFLILFLLILDNILAYMCLKKNNKKHKWKSRVMYYGLIRKMFIYFSISMASLIVEKVVNIPGIYTIVIGVMLVPELKSIDEKLMCLYNKTVFSYILDKLFPPSNYYNNTNTKNNK